MGIISPQVCDRFRATQCCLLWDFWSKMTGNRRYILFVIRLRLLWRFVRLLNLHVYFCVCVSQILLLCHSTYTLVVPLRNAPLSALFLDMRANAVALIGISWIGNHLHWTMGPLWSLSSIRTSWLRDQRGFRTSWCRAYQTMVNESSTTTTQLYICTVTKWSNMASFCPPSAPTWKLLYWNTLRRWIWYAGCEMFECIFSLYFANYWWFTTR